MHHSNHSNGRGGRRCTIAATGGGLCHGTREARENARVMQCSFNSYLKKRVPWCLRSHAAGTKVVPLEFQGRACDGDGARAHTHAGVTIIHVARQTFRNRPNARLLEWTMRAARRTVRVDTYQLQNLACPGTYIWVTAVGRNSNLHPKRFIEWLQRNRMQFRRW